MLSCEQVKRSDQKHLPLCCVAVNVRDNIAWCKIARSNISVILTEHIRNSLDVQGLGVTIISSGTAYLWSIDERERVSITDAFVVTSRGHELSVSWSNLPEMPSRRNLIGANSGYPPLGFSTHWNAPLALGTRRGSHSRRPSTGTDHRMNLR